MDALFADVFAYRSQGQETENAKGRDSVGDAQVHFAVIVGGVRAEFEATALVAMVHDGSEIAIFKQKRCSVV